eukprot:m.228727 g.228727  ORF g.228727 m.228727 type:complete len:108 (+) comp17575_c0_seq1:2559-2882(+)
MSEPISMAKAFLGERIQANMSDVNTFLQHTISKSGSVETMVRTIRQFNGEESVIASTSQALKNMQDNLARMQHQSDKMLESLQNVPAIRRSLEACTAPAAGPAGSAS